MKPHHVAMIGWVCTTLSALVGCALAGEWSQTSKIVDDAYVSRVSLRTEREGAELWADACIALSPFRKGDEDLGFFRPNAKATPNIFSVRFATSDNAEDIIYTGSLAVSVNYDDPKALITAQSLPICFTYRLSDAYDFTREGRYEIAVYFWTGNPKTNKTVLIRSPIELVSWVNGRFWP